MLLACLIPAAGLTGELNFMADPMLGRPTDRSVTVNVISPADLDVYIEYGASPGAYPNATPPLLACPATQPIEMVIDGLAPDTRYYYRLRCRLRGEDVYSTSSEGSFHTQRRRGSVFVFTIQADSHLLQRLMRKKEHRLRMYERTLGNVALDRPDFHIDMGDFAHVEWFSGGCAASLDQAIERYLNQRKFLGRISHSVPFFLVLGNHEGEHGRRRFNPYDSLEIWGTLARKAIIPNPYPDGFYSGNPDTTGCCGLREDYYAWEWGDALFVVLDPYWYTPFPSAEVDSPKGGAPRAARMDGWDWTLGEAQYNWLYDTLHGSDARWKFVFGHQMTGGVLSGPTGHVPYGRGGKDAAKFAVSGRPSFEWGGEDERGDFVFDEKRPGWSHGPIHDIMVAEGVDVFFHGHDHAFVYESLDGMVYQACPVPAGSGRPAGFYRKDYYSTGIVQPNSGHLRVVVSAGSVRVDYIRSVLPGDEPLLEDGNEVTNGMVSYSYSLMQTDR